MQLQLSQNEFRPGELIRGNLVIGDKGPTESIEVRLFWFTQGKGDLSHETLSNIVIDAPQANSSFPFEFSAPGRPYSFSGKLISLQWAIEAVAFPSRNTNRIELTISSTGKEILLDKSFKDEVVKPWFSVGNR